METKTAQLAQETYFSIGVARTAKTSHDRNRKAAALVFADRVLQIRKVTAL
jgi:hypothetical protein